MQNGFLNVRLQEMYVLKGPSADNFPAVIAYSHVDTEDS